MADMKLPRNRYINQPRRFFGPIMRGGEWNGRSGPGPLKLTQEVWEWRTLIVELAFQKTIARYRASRLGPAWIVLGFSLFVFGIGALWSALQHIPISTYLPYIAVGMFAWNIMLGVLTEGCRSLTENRALIHQSRAPLLVYPLVTTLKQLLLAGHSLVVVIPVLIFCRVDITPEILWIVPGALCLLVAATSVCICLSIAGAYLPDLAEMIVSVLRFCFFFTPVFWMTDMRPSFQIIWLLNPFYYAIESVRGPVLGTSDPKFILPVLAGLTAVVLTLSALAYGGWSRGARTRV